MLVRRATAVVVVSSSPSVGGDRRTAGTLTLDRKIGGGGKRAARPGGNELGFDPPVTGPGFVQAIGAVSRPIRMDGPDR